MHFSIVLLHMYFLCRIRLLVYQGVLRFSAYSKTKASERRRANFPDLPVSSWHPKPAHIVRDLATVTALP